MRRTRSTQCGVVGPYMFNSRMREIFRANINQLKSDIQNETQCLLNEETSDTPINELWLRFKSILTRARDKNVPSKISSKRFSQRWFNRNCKRMVGRKNRKYKIYQRTKLSSDWSKYQNAAKEARKTCRNAYHKHINDTFISERKSNPKKFYSFIKSKNQDNIGIPEV